MSQPSWDSLEHSIPRHTTVLAIDERVDEIIHMLAPLGPSNKQRRQVFEFVEAAIRDRLGAASFLTGSFATNCYLPDDPVEVRLRSNISAI